MQAGKIALGVLAGLAAGALVGILLAPDKGSKTRKKLMRKGGDYADALKEKFDTFVDAMNEKYESLKKEAEHIIAHENGHDKSRGEDMKKKTSGAGS